jgi:hypothetical protein
MNPREIEQLEAMKAEQQRMKQSAQNQMAGCDMPSRERTSREVLAELCMSKQVEADELNDLLKALPQELPYRADRALRRLIQQR